MHWRLSKLVFALLVLAIVFAPILYSTQIGKGSTIDLTSSSQSSSIYSQEVKTQSYASSTVTNFSTSIIPSNSSFSATTMSSVASNTSTLSNKPKAENLIGNEQTNSGTATTSSLTTLGFNSSNLLLINETAFSQIQFIESLEMPNGAILQSTQNHMVYSRDLALAALALTLSNKFTEANRALDFILSISQGRSNFSDPKVPTSPPAWAQIYSADGGVLDPSLRGEDQGMVLLAVSTFAVKAGDMTLIKNHWTEIENSANFIVYLQHAPEPSVPYNGMYRHGDNWHDARQENVNGSRLIYWPYWPEYYQWEEENMRMISGLRGAIHLAQNLGMSSDVQKWNQSVTVAETGIKDESIYNKFETYDYFGSVLWGIQTDLQSEKNVLAAIPSDLFTTYGLKDLSWENYAGAPDTIDYMVCLVRVGDFASAGYYLGLLLTKYENPSGGFFEGLNLDGTVAYQFSTVYTSARFVYFAYVVSTLGNPHA